MLPGNSQCLKRFRELNRENSRWTWGVTYGDFIISIWKIRALIALGWRALSAIDKSVSRRDWSPTCDLIEISFWKINHWISWDILSEDRDLQNDLPEYWRPTHSYHTIEYKSSFGLVLTTENDVCKNVKKSQIS